MITIKKERKKESLFAYCYQFCYYDLNNNAQNDSIKWSAL